MINILKKPMTYGEIKETEMYIKAEDVSVSVNEEEPIDEQYYPYELDMLPVVGTGHMANGELHIDLACANWDKRFDVDWVAK